MRAILAILVALAAVPAAAQLPQDAGAWKRDGDRVGVTASGISLPGSAASMSLATTGEASLKGQGVDNVAQYYSADRKVFATIYIFYSPYADTALATWATDRAIHERFGANVVMIDESVVAAGGAPGTAARRLYDKGRLAPGGDTLVSAMGYVRAGAWMIGLRVTGPTGRRSEVEGGLDALLAGLRFDGKDKPMSVASLKLAAPCPASDDKPAKSLSDKTAGANALLGGLLGGAIVIRDERSGTTNMMARPLAFPANGAQALCVRGQVHVGDGMVDMLQPADAAAAALALIVLDDAGGTIAIEPAILGNGFVMKHYAIGHIETLGSYDRIPTATQIGAILEGRDAKGAMVRSNTLFTPGGKSTIEINANTLK